MWGRELHAWARDDATVDVFEKNKACLMGITTAWLFGLSLGTDFLQDPIAADLFFNPFKQSSSGRFWRSEFPKPRDLSNVRSSLLKHGTPVVS